MFLSRGLWNIRYAIPRPSLVISLKNLTMREPLQIKEIRIDRILNPTSIDLGEYVINPYKGCELGCVYCYVKTNRATWESPRPWGSYVDVRANSPEQLAKELTEKKVKTVLLGSTTELFQPIEKKYQL